VPRQHSTGGRARLLGSSKRGDVYLRPLLGHGARATLRWVGLKTARRSQWVRALSERRGKNKAAGALANKNARIAWVLWSSEQTYTAEEIVVC
jgi:transposase